MREIKVKGINQEATRILLDTKMINPVIVPFYEQLRNDSWRFLATEQTRGWCRKIDRTITIPVWAMNRKIDQTGYFTWYLSHEMAHAFDKENSNHGLPFMRELLRICPPAFLKYEMNYKGTNATRAGIHSVMDMTLEELL